MVDGRHGRVPGDRSEPVGRQVLVDGAAPDAAGSRSRAGSGTGRSGLVDRYLHEISGGELLRVNRARALLARPRYLDEIGAGLHSITQARIGSQLGENSPRLVVADGSRVRLGGCARQEGTRCESGAAPQR
jgi:hypothetical protein